jgi:hypothetical protein
MPWLDVLTERGRQGKEITGRATHAEFCRCSLILATVSEPRWYREALPFSSLDEKGIVFINTIQHDLLQEGNVTLEA